MFAQSNEQKHQFIVLVSTYGRKTEGKVFAFIIVQPLWQSIKLLPLKWVLHHQRLNKFSFGKGEGRRWGTSTSFGIGSLQSALPRWKYSKFKVQKLAESGTAKAAPNVLVLTALVNHARHQLSGKITLWCSHFVYEKEHGLSLPDKQTMSDVGNWQNKPAFCFSKNHNNKHQCRVIPD